MGKSKMGKSSSLKKKRSKNSSQSQMRKRNKVKSRRSKSKKLRCRHDDSISCSDDSDLRSMVSVSSSSSEDDYGSRRSRSRNRKVVKGGKKRARTRSSSRESSEDSPYVKKRSRSRGDDKRKRTGKRKKSMRDLSVSSRSSGSLSCSTCWSGSDEIGYETRRGRSERKEKDRRRLEKDKTGSKRSKDRSRSCSYSRYNEGNDNTIELRVMEESNSRRLKSVITAVKHEKESSRELNTDEPKEEVYDYDDYPSCRSNDSNDGCSRRELPQHSHVVSKTKRSLDDEKGEVSNIRTNNVEESGKDGKPRYDALREKRKVSSPLNGDDMESILRQRALENLRKFRGGLQTNINPPITQNDKNDDDVKTPSSADTDLFQITVPKGDDSRVVMANQVSQPIRQHPVRIDSTNLPKNDRNTSYLNDVGKYSGTVGSEVASPPALVVPAGVPRVEFNTAINTASNKSKLVMSQARLEATDTCITQKKEAAAQEPSQAKLVTKTSVNEGGLKTAQTVKPPEDNAASVSNRPKSVKWQIRSRTRLEAPNTRTTQKQEAAAQEPSKTKSSVNEGGLETAQTVKPHEYNAASVSNRPKSVKSQIRQESPNTYTTQKQESAQAKLVTESSVNEGSLETAHTVNPPECGNSGGKVNDTHDSAFNKPFSSSISTAGGISSDKLEDETNDGSQFQQKTMSVMRGGEMVQVSYQVYIPKRAAALARRQLKR
ncbi:uncharacterized protein DDB_G0287625-like isoform X1 [Durio zibethinus]|uniref:Uncharacterized protein DDB_G0287625-like isoform X1 n=2 Tax=Durio zibethinus TaxID=66656 RepID=A0A6P5Y460_DURZI|nr:uncharacterized protein DDB_G0287625-like isoform X1 [Durio zibethinus]